MQEIKTDRYTPILYSNSYIQMVWWHADGTVDPHGILTYSQSDDPASPFCADQNRLYSKGQWLQLPLYVKGIVADKYVKTPRLRHYFQCLTWSQPRWSHAGLRIDSRSPSYSCRPECVSP